mgnify:CR=1 FL=1
MDAESKKALQARLRRVAGQVAGIERMVEEDRYCVDVIAQISAARAALAKASAVLLRSHVETCVHAAFAGKDLADRSQKIEELVRLFDKNCNC